MDVILPPPQQANYKKGLMKLLHACGITDVSLSDPDNDNYWEVDSESTSISSSSLSLAKFLPWATEQIRLKEASRSDPALKLANLCGALRLGRQVYVSFPSLSDLASERRLQLVSSLVGVLESRPHLDLKGCHIMFGSAPSGIDRLGHLCLSQDDTVNEWLTLLQEVRNI